MLLGDQQDESIHTPSAPPCLLDQNQESNESCTEKPQQHLKAILLVLCLASPGVQGCIAKVKRMLGLKESTHTELLGPHCAG